MFCKKGKADSETNKINKEMFFFNVNVFDLNQKHLQVFQASDLLKSTKETASDTQKNLIKYFKFLLCFSRLART